MATQAAIDLGDATVSVNCSAVEVGGPVDDAVIGMLVAVVRAAERRGARVALVRAPRVPRAQFEAAGIAPLVDWRG